MHLLYLKHTYHYTITLTRHHSLSLAHAHTHTHTHTHSLSLPLMHEPKFLQCEQDHAEQCQNSKMWSCSKVFFLFFSCIDPLIQFFFLNQHTNERTDERMNGRTKGHAGTRARGEVGSAIQGRSRVGSGGRLGDDQGMMWSMHLVGVML